MLSHSDQHPSVHNEVSKVPEFSSSVRYNLPLKIGAQSISDAIHENETKDDFDQRLVAEALESQCFVRVAPRLSDQVTDLSRTNTFEHTGKPQLGIPGGTMTEHEGLLNLIRTIKGSIQEDAWSEVGHTSEVNDLADIGTNLTFIGEKEYQEGARGLAAFWKQYLNEDSRNTICAPLALSKPKDTRKSDDYLLERILDTFTDEEIDHYQGRVLGDFDSVRSAPDHTRVVLLDDWSISGAQVGDMYASLRRNAANFEKYKGRIEVNNLAASEERLENGMTITSRYEPVHIPIRAYYKAHVGDARDTNARITGTHSSVDYGFKYDLEYIVRKIYGAEHGSTALRDIPYIPLANIIRTYRHTAPHLLLSPDGVIKRIHHDA